MKILKGKTVVITGAGSGIGSATAIRCAKEGMNIVLSDVQEDNLLKVEEIVKNIGANCISVITDVSDSEQLEMLATTTLSVFKSIDVLFNNAGVIHVGSILEHTEKDWQWVLGVNLFGVINGVRIFAPLMRDQLTESNIVINASIGGFTTGAGLAAYKISKHALIAFSEILEAELTDSQVRVSVLCPGWTNTQLMQSEATRPEKYIDFVGFTQNNQESNMHLLRGIESAKNGAPPEFIAECVLDAVINNKFYVIPDTSFHDKFKDRVSRIIEA